MNQDTNGSAQIQTAADTLIVVEDENLPQTVVATFTKRADAEAAVRAINKALRTRKGSIHQGAIVTRPADGGEVTVHDLRDAGLFDLARGSFTLAWDTGSNGVRLLWSTIGAGIFFFAGGWRLVRTTTNRALALLGTGLTMPRRLRLDSFGSGADAAQTGAQLEPGGSAVVVVADRDTAAQLATDLVKAGGNLV